MELQKCLEGRRSTYFAEATFAKLLNARRELCRLHGTDLTRPHITRRISHQLEGAASKPSGKIDTQLEKPAKLPAQVIMNEVPASSLMG